MGEGVNKYSSKRRITERGHSAQLARNITKLESQIRNLKDEQLHIFDSKGNKLKFIQGKGARVSFNLKDIPKDAIHTHNHPLSLGKSGTEAIGHSFSRADISTAIKSNAKEMRAVTPTYTFSVKRPQGGWGDTKRALSDYKKVLKATDKKMDKYLAQAKTMEDLNMRFKRFDILYFHLVMKEMGKKYGWDYSKTKG